MARAIIAAIALIAFASPASATSPGELLLLCNEALLGNGATCTALVEAVEQEMDGLDMGVVPGEQPVEMAAGDVPAPIMEATAAGEVSCGAWIALTPGGPSLEVYTPGSVQTRSSIPIAHEAQGTLDTADAAFRLRSILAAAFFLDLPGIEENAPAQGMPPPAPSPPDEPAKEPPLLPHASDPGSETEGGAHTSGPGVMYMGWIRAEAGYALIGYPTEKHWYHALGLSLGVVLVARLELFVDAAISAPIEMELGTTTSGTNVRIENAQYLVGMGLGYGFRPAARVSLAPRIGFHLGISESEVRALGTETHRRLNAAMWAGIEVRVALTGFLALNAAFSIENLFNYEYFEIVENMTTRRVFSLAQLRLDLAAGITFSF